MSTELRQNPATGLWSCHQQRAQHMDSKPSGYAKGNMPHVQLTHERDMRSGKDPFDLANQELCPHILASAADPKHPSVPLVRAFENKFPALLKPEANLVSTEQAVRSGHVMPAMGAQEVVVQHWRYNTCAALMTREECQILWSVLRERVQKASPNTNAACLHYSMFWCFDHCPR